MRNPTHNTEILDLVSQLAKDSARFAKAEVSLAKAELSDAIRKQVITILIFFIGLLIGLVSLIILADTPCYKIKNHPKWWMVPRVIRVIL